MALKLTAYNVHDNNIMVLKWFNLFFFTDIII